LGVLALGLPVEAVRLAHEVVVAVEVRVEPAEVRGDVHVVPLPGQLDHVPAVPLLVKGPGDHRDLHAADAAQESERLGYAFADPLAGQERAHGAVGGDGVGVVVLDGLHKVIVDGQLGPEAGVASFHARLEHVLRHRLHLLHVRGPVFHEPVVHEHYFGLVAPGGDVQAVLHIEQGPVVLYHRDKYGHEVVDRGLAMAGDDDLRLLGEHRLFHLLV
jgi:hypothetical protein